MSIFFPLETNRFFEHALRGTWESDWTQLRAIEYRLKLSFLLFEDLFIEFSPLLQLAITANDTRIQRERKIYDWLDFAGGHAELQSVLHRPMQQQGVDANIRSAIARSVAIDVEGMFPALARWTSQFGLLIDRAPIEKKVLSSDFLPLKFRILESKHSSVHFVALNREAYQESYTAGTLLRSIPQPHLHQPDDFEQTHEMVRSELSARRIRNKQLDAWAAHALQSPIHYVPCDYDSGDLDDIYMKTEILDAFLEIGAPDFGNVHLTTILELRETRSCKELRALIDEFVNRIRHSTTISETRVLRQEIQKMWTKKLLEESLLRQADYSTLRVNLFTGAISMIPGVGNLVSGLQMANDIRRYIDDQNSWMRIVSDLRKY